MTAAARAPTPVPRDNQPENRQINGPRQTELMAALQKSLNLMHDCDTSRFDEVFRPTAHIHGFRTGEMKSWSADVYKNILNQRQSPKSQNAPREDEIPVSGFRIAGHGARQSAGADSGMAVRRLSDLALRRWPMADHLQGFPSRIR